VATRSVPRNKSNMRVSLQLINTHLESVIGGNETPSPSDSPLLGVKFGGGGEEGDGRAGGGAGGQR
jgi:hypothetical protein